jgi:hypothetical protein
MSRVPFPHVLGQPTVHNNSMISFVTDQIIKNNLLLEAAGYISTNAGYVQVWHVYRIHEIVEQRPASGDWTAYDTHPTFYKAKATYQGRKTQGDIDQSALFNPVTQ